MASGCKLKYLSGKLHAGGWVEAVAEEGGEEGRYGRGRRVVGVATWKDKDGLMRKNRYDLMNRHTVLQEVDKF